MILIYHHILCYFGEIQYAKANKIVIYFKHQDITWNIFKMQIPYKIIKLIINPSNLLYN